MEALKQKEQIEYIPLTGLSDVEKNQTRIEKEDNKKRLSVSTPPKYCVICGRDTKGNGFCSFSCEKDFYGC
jgi:hypothetical protein